MTNIAYLKIYHKMLSNLDLQYAVIDNNKFEAETPIIYVTIRDNTITIWPKIHIRINPLITYCQCETEEFIRIATEYPRIYEEALIGLLANEDIINYLISHGFDNPLILLRRESNKTITVFEMTYIRPPSIIDTPLAQGYLSLRGFTDSVKIGDTLITFTYNVYYKKIIIETDNPSNIALIRDVLISILNRNREYIENI